MRAKVSRPRLLAGTATILVVASLIWYGTRGPNLNARTREYAESLRLGDWGHIYDMAPPKILRLQPWNRGQFITMMKTLDHGTLERSNQVEIKPIEGSLRSMKSFTFNTLPDSGTNAKTGPSITIAFLRDFDDWRPDIFYVPLQLSLALYPEQRERAAALLYACQTAKISRIVRLTGPTSLEVNRIPDFLAGKIEWANLFHTGSDLLVSANRAAAPE